MLAKSCTCLTGPSCTPIVLFVAEHGFDSSDRLLNRTLTAQCGRYSRVAHAPSARTLLFEHAQPPTAPDCPVLVPVECPGHQCVVRSPVRVTYKRSKRLWANRRNRSFSLGQSVLQICSYFVHYLTNKYAAANSYQCHLSLFYTLCPCTRGLQPDQWTSVVKHKLWYHRLLRLNTRRENG